MKQADQHHLEREFEGDWVFVRLQPYKQLSMKREGKNKLDTKFYGPFQVIKKINDIAYGLKLPDNCQIRNVFHLSCLKKVLGQNQSSQNQDT